MALMWGKRDALTGRVAVASHESPTLKAARRDFACDNSL